MPTQGADTGGAGHTRQIATWAGSRCRCRAPQTLTPGRLRPDPLRVRAQAFDRTGDIAPSLSRGALTLLCAFGKFAGDIHRLGTEPPDHFPRDVFNVIICHYQSSKKTGAFIGAEVWGNCCRYVESSRDNKIDQDGSG
jgi:hypothetical protein